VLYPPQRRYRTPRNPHKLGFFGKLFCVVQVGIIGFGILATAVTEHNLSPLIVFGGIGLFAICANLFLPDPPRNNNPPAPFNLRSFALSLAFGLPLAAIGFLILSRPH
jgi:hypothetical protein